MSTPQHPELNRWVQTDYRSLRPPLWTLAARVGAALLDLGIVLVITFAIIAPVTLLGLRFDMTQLTPQQERLAEELTTWVFWSVFVLYGVLMVAQRGQTVGRMAAHVRVIRADGGQVGFLRALLRELLRPYLIVLTLGLDLLWTLWDPRRQTLHDKLFQTLVVPADTPLEF